MVKVSDAKACKLALADGLVFTGRSFAAEGTAEGEVVFNTGMTGYQEVLTDPSYTGQIVAMTYPLIGNYGVNDEDVESHNRKVQPRAFVVKELSPIASNFRSDKTLQEYLADAGIMALSNIDTRALTSHIRLAGAMNGAMSTEILDDDQLVSRARAIRPMLGMDLVKVVTPDAAYDWAEGYISQFAQAPRDHGKKIYDVVAIDCGAKMNIMRNLVACGCNVRVVPATAGAEEILECKPQGVFVSNGPGDPAAVTYTAEAMEGIVGRVPVFGICLGHQILACALGAKTYKLKFGHHGCNHPVRNEATGKVEITSQNHGFAVEAESIKDAGAQVTHVNLNDMTVEGFSHSDKCLFSVQYHPEASPGPHDATYLFDCFRDMMAGGSAPTAEQMHAAQEKLAKARWSPAPPHGLDQSGASFRR
ncbi:MAG: glutamine-hydrolyzing carbamoyl-phosphate synthase small subunit [Phycisphaerae bacterium]|nr:glutamine-hydrolyzing carbamoyl-phosphate synthase small subunit [Phycisphaerae bacterium]MDP7637037.1 glutamine-hydrolyzing carbamoyl-phosphate synthase small subunit [Phycisphaerae bacterium]